MMVSYAFWRRFLFQLPAETAHSLTLKLLKCAQYLGWRQLRQAHPIRFLGTLCEQPVGLAAGLDKNGDYIDALARLGFGAIEVGTVTPRPQPGNPKPRLFRLVKDKAVINRMGFNNKGVAHCARQLKRTRYKGMLGANIGKNFDTPIERAAEDYLHCLEVLYPLVSYITVNVSSPNTQGLRALQHGQQLSELIEQLTALRAQLKLRYARYVPILYKIAPDLSDVELSETVDIFLKHQVDGVIATNTTLAREGLRESTLAEETGGLSGAPLLSRSVEVVRKIVQQVQGQFPVVGVGGIQSAEDAQLFYDAGASFVQVYTGLVYQGPGLIAHIATRARF